MTKEITCIVCPVGCLMAVEQDGDSITAGGAQCRRGAEFAGREMRNPTRSLTSTVKTVFADFPYLPVRTSAEIPKDKLFEAMGRINGVLIKERLRTADIVIKDVFGADIIATADMTTAMHNSQFTMHN
ncbi:MAG: DUF1667 domain-containing protein [Oscillospiraceae bacterium]|nr:DUF1667 domain-containing protein [Oscillospiraceae bacterium]